MNTVYININCTPTHAILTKDLHYEECIYIYTLMEVKLLHS